MQYIEVGGHCATPFFVDEGFRILIRIIDGANASEMNG